MKYLWLMFLCWQVAEGSVGKRLQLKGSQGIVTVPALADWRLEKNVMGLPFVYFSPKLNGERSNLSIISTSSEIEFQSLKLKQDQKSYMAGKLAWAKKVNAEIIRQKPFKVWVNEFGLKVHQIGIEYRYNLKNYSEVSYFIGCEKRTLILKSLNLDSNSQHQRSFETIVNEINCES